MDLEHNNVIRFNGISKKKDGIFANFKVKGIRGGTYFSASITVDILAADVDLNDPLETIIEQCAKIALKEIKRSDFSIESISAV
ncbi:MAG: hypothetical protein HN411_01375 [Waddliaceae bacterium]|jgi:hypothetical protein|nr:hypothetical protein [Waddliaceae bacterium]MBT3579364.1 hypothetical protein [Waddliaceae bacterium]MBT4444854.1 hypothetical protein [Waddliaceae bacterium]MBT6928010.1 hypothetical protein [Waddliaceae bacterium]MBT7264314.1 hypothetical protein [Waddliaceae bacterium]